MEKRPRQSSHSEHSQSKGKKRESERGRYARQEDRDKHERQESKETERMRKTIALSEHWKYPLSFSALLHECWKAERKMVATQSIPVLPFPFLYVFTPQPHQKGSNSLSSTANKKWTHISSFSIIINIIMIFFFLKNRCRYRIWDEKARVLYSCEAWGK